MALSGPRLTVTHRTAEVALSGQLLAVTNRTAESSCPLSGPRLAVTNRTVESRWLFLAHVWP